MLQFAANTALAVHHKRVYPCNARNVLIRRNAQGVGRLPINRRKMPVESNIVKIHNGLPLRRFPSPATPQRSDQSPHKGCLAFKKTAVFSYIIGHIFDSPMIAIMHRWPCLQSCRKNVRCNNDQIGQTGH